MDCRSKYAVEGATYAADGVAAATWRYYRVGKETAAAGGAAADA